MQNEEMKQTIRHAQKTERNSNIELFRIIAMLLIIAHHYVVNSGLTSVDGPIYTNPLSWRSLFLLIFGAWGKIGINCFVLITGYFMCDSQISGRKFAKLILEIAFYKIAIYFGFLLSGYEAFSLSGLAKIIFPYREISTGFTFCFLLFYLSIPFLNILLQHLNQKQHQFLLLLCCFIYVLFGTVPYFSVSMNYFSWFIVLFFIAAYLKRYTVCSKRKIPWGWLTLGMIIVDIASVVCMAWASDKYERRIAFLFVTDSNTLLALLTGVSAFMWFINLRVKNNIWINIIASTTFGIFLIHANSDTMRQWLWVDVFDVVGHYMSTVLPLYAIGVVLIVFITGAVIDYGRKNLIESFIFHLWDNRRKT